MKNSALLLAAAIATLGAPAGAFADTASATATTSATIQLNGPRLSSGNVVTNSFNIEGVDNGNFESWGVLDFNVDSFNISYPATTVSNLKLTLTEYNAAFTVGNGGLAFYLVTDTTTSIAADSPLKFQSADAPEGLGTQLGTPYALGTGVFPDHTGSSNSGYVDEYTLNLSPEAATYFLSQLNAGGSLLRLVVTPTDATGASTWAGPTHTTTTWWPKLSFDVTLDQPTLTWVGGDGTWNATGGTDWSGGPWDSSKTAVFATGSGVVALGTDITTNGITFNTSGYSINGAGHTLTLPGSAGGNTITVTNAADSAAISAPIAGTSGLVKSGAGTLALLGANTFTGAVTVSGGTLFVAGDLNLGGPANDIVLNGGTLKSTAALTLMVGAGRTLSGSGTLDASGGPMEFAGPVAAGVLSLTANSFVTLSGSGVSLSSVNLGADSTLVINGPVTSAGRTTFSGDGTVRLNGDNSGFAAGVQMSKGAGAVGPTVAMGSATALGTGDLFFNAGTLSASTPLTGANAIVTNISMGGSVATSGSDMEFNGSFGFFGSTAKTLTVNNNITINSGIGSGTAQNILIKAGPGKLTLTALNSYADGTQILAGTIEVTSGGTLGLGSVTISPGATLTLDSETSVDDASDLFLLSGGGLFATLDLNFDASLAETVNSLTIDGNPIAAGTYTSADFPNFLTGDGKLAVLVTIPEPDTLLLVLAAGIAFVVVRRRA